MVKMQPRAVFVFHDALCTQNNAVLLAVIERLQNLAELVFREFLRRLDAQLWKISSASWPW